MYGVEQVQRVRPNTRHFAANVRAGPPNSSLSTKRTIPSCFAQGEVVRVAGTCSVERDILGVGYSA